MENKKNRKKIWCDYKDDLPSVRKLIKYQEKLFNVTYRNGRWVRRYNAKKSV